jgi:hypothetical protein
MDLKLSPGNVYGQVDLSGAGPAIGAIVFAEAYQSSDPSLAVVGLTRESIVDEDGNYGLQLDAGFTWKIKVFYVSLTSDEIRYRSLTRDDEVYTAIPVGTSRLEKDFVLPIDSGN